MPLGKSWGRSTEEQFKSARRLALTFCRTLCEHVERGRALERYFCELCAIHHICPGHGVMLLALATKCIDAVCLLTLLITSFDMYMKIKDARQLGDSL